MSNQPEIRIVKLNTIDLEHSPMVRAELNAETIEEYTESYRLKEKIPQCVLFDTSPGPILVGDGWHRCNAMLKAGIKEMSFLVYRGTYETCLKFALQANLHHGLRRTNADKRAGVVLALNTFPKMSNSVIAEMAAVGDDLVADVRKGMESKGAVKAESTLVGKDGRERPANLRKTKVEGEQNDENKGKSEEAQPASPVPARPAGTASADKAGDVQAQTDETGYPLTATVLPLWERRREVKELLGYLDTVKRTVTKALALDDRLYSAEIRATFITDIANIVTHLKGALPFAVCPYCQGQLPEKCRFCGQRGVVSESKYGATPEEVKKVRNAAIKK